MVLTKDSIDYQGFEESVLKIKKKINENESRIVSKDAILTY